MFSDNIYSIYFTELSKLAHHQYYQEFNSFQKITFLIEALFRALVVLYIYPDVPGFSVQFNKHQVFGLKIIAFNQNISL